jgi:hypothetical protein
VCISLENCLGSGHAGRHPIERLDRLTLFGLTTLLHSIEGSSAIEGSRAQIEGSRARRRRLLDPRSVSFETGRKRTALDWMALAAEEHGREILEVYLQAMRGGDWRAAEALMSRIYGKPEAIVVPHAAPNPTTAVLKSMSLAEKLELLRSLQRGKSDELPVIEGSATTSNELER